jgi:hypothetical protein
MVFFHIALQPPNEKQVCMDYTMLFGGGVVIWGECLEPKPQTAGNPSISFLPL